MIKFISIFFCIYTKITELFYFIKYLFDMNKLKEIMFEDHITELKIPQSKRIFIFEDIDCMGDVVHTRDEIEEKEEKKEEKEEKENIKIEKSI